jgi:hypothetical protein
MRIQDQSQAIARCAHIKLDGVRCGSPTLHERDYCYFHNRVRRMHVPPALPVLEDRNALQYAIGEVLAAVMDDRVDLKKARTLLYGMQIAAYNLRTGVNFEPYAPNVVRIDPAEQYFEQAMKKLPENASVDEVMNVINTAAKG